MSSYISGAADFLRRKTSQAISIAATRASDAKAQAMHSIQAPLLHDKGSDIDEIRDYLSYLSTPGKKFSAAGNNTALLKERATLTDFLNRVKQILANGKELFNLNLEEHKSHQRPFIDLIVHLEAEITYLEDNQEESKELSENTLDALTTALRKLQQLKVMQAGIFTTTARFAEAAPELLQSVDHLTHLQKAIFTNNSKKIIDAWNLLKPCLETLLKYKDTIFYKPELSAHDELVFKELSNTFKAYQNLPESLRQDNRFHPNDDELMAVIKKMATTLTLYITPKSAIKKKLAAMLSSATQFAKDQLPAVDSSTNSVTHYSPVQKLSDAITFFIGPGKGYPAKDKEKLLLELLHECNESHADFETHFLDAIAKTNPQEGAISHDWAKDHLLDYPMGLEGALKVALKKEARALGFTETHPTKDALLKFLNARAPLQNDETPSTLDTSDQASHSNSLITYAKDILGLLSGKASIPEAALAMTGNGFASILNGELLTDWISTQKPGARDVLNNIKNETLAALDIAINSKSLADYKQAFQLFIRLWNNPIISVDGMTLPNFFQDKDISQAQSKATEKLNKTMTELRKALNLAKTQEDPDFDWNDTAAVSEKIKGQIEQFSDNLQDQLTYQLLIGKQKPDDRTFFKIKDLQKVKGSKDAKKQFFFSELKKAIDKSSAPWLTKIASKFILSSMHWLIGYYVNSIVKEFYKDLDKGLENIDKQDLLVRSSNCFSKYNALLKAWANDKKGGDKNPIINQLMQTKKFLSYGEESYTQAALYNEFSNTFIQKYLKGDSDQGNNLTGFLSSRLTKINEMIKKPVFYAAGNPFFSFFNYAFVGVKAILIGIPCHVIIRLASIPLRVGESITNKSIKFLFKKGLARFKTANAIIQSTREGIYDNPYAHAITSFLADQLESLSQELEGVKAPSTGAVDESEDPSSDTAKAKKAISENSRDLIRKAAEGFLEILNKDGYSTQDQLREYLDPTTKGYLAIANDKLEGTVLPLIIDSIIDITAIASDKLLNKKGLQQPISLLLDKLNDILTQAPEDLDKEKLQIEKLKYQAAKEKLEKYTEKLLDLVITKAIDDIFQQQGQRQITLINETTEWLKTETPDFLAKCEEQFQLINLEEPTDAESYKAVEKLYQIIDKFLVKLENKRDLLKKDSSTTSKKLSQSLLKIINPLETLLHGPDKTGGFLSFYEHYKTIYKTDKDLPHLTACERSYESLERDLPTLADDFTDVRLTKRIFENSRYIKKTLSRIHSKDLSFSREPSKYRALNDLLDPSNQLMIQRETAELSIQESFLPMLQSINAITERTDGNNLFNLLTTQKQAQLNGTTGILASLRGGSDPFKITYNETLKKIQKVPSEETKKELTVLLNAIYYAKNTTALTASVANFRDRLNNFITDQKQKLNSRVQAILDIDKQFYKEIHALCEEFKEEIEVCEQANKQLKPQIEDAMQEMNGAANGLESISFIDTTVGVTNLLKIPPYHVAYHLAKKKVTGIFKLLKDGNFSQFFANHALVMPFTKK